MARRPTVIRDPDRMRQHVSAMHIRGEKVGLVPTMGAIHEGHLSLVRAAEQECDKIIVTIFVNPTQFAPNEDLDKYPRDLHADLDLLADLKVEFVFAPEVESMYPEGFSTYIEGPAATELLEGEKRPAHFRGVTTIVAKLFNIIPADHAYFGQKDFQQAFIIYRMATDLDFGVNVRICPIIREVDGLAMSSRNAYLDDEQRTQALALWNSLKLGNELILAGERVTEQVTRQMEELLLKEGVSSIDYVHIADPESLEPAVLQRAADNDERVVLLVAAYVGKTRLIDNLIVDLKSNS